MKPDQEGMHHLKNLLDSHQLQSISLLRGVELESIQDLLEEYPIIRPPEYEGTGAGGGGESGKLIPSPGPDSLRQQWNTLRGTQGNGLGLVFVAVYYPSDQLPRMIIGTLSGCFQGSMARPPLTSPFQSRESFRMLGIESEGTLVMVPGHIRIPKLFGP